jgi:ADP-heptose:LPS heptosyltransferase
MTVSDDRLILRIPDSALHRARDILAGLHRSSGPTVVLHPGCSMPARTYPWQRFARAADELIERLDATIILTGSDEEAELTARIHARMRHDAVDAAGSLDFPTFAGLIAAAELVITNNTGPMHMAAALRTPVVTLFALTNHPQQWGPWRVPHRTLYHDVPCRLCYSRICPHQHECLTRITPSMVADAAEDLLAEVATGAGAA